jgi:ABC-type branched-subunit amino acid transport system substrate-binding protein
MGRRLGILVAVLGLFVTAACTGAPRPENVAADRTTGEAATEVEGATAERSDTTVAGQAVDAAGNPIAGPGTTGKPGATATTPGAAGPVPGVKGPDGIIPANLFAANQDRIGITDKQITLCGHAALIFATAFNTQPEDINVYWEDVRNRGGIHGRNVAVTYEDDRYEPAAAVQAAETCKTKNPFFILGGIGFDQIPAVRNWAEQNKQLYIHHIAVEKGGEGKQYSFTPQPSVEQVGTASGEFIAGKYKGKKIGIVYRNSENWDPGFKAGKAYLESHGVNIVTSLPVEKQATVYSSQVLELRSRGVEVVWFWENALAAAEFIKQAHNQDYHPTYVVFPFQTTLDVLGSDTYRSPIDGVSTWPAYKPGGYTGPASFPGTGYNEEIARFEAAMRKYRPGVTPNDILWQVWLGNKGLEDMFLKCGRDCTRNKFAGLLMAYKGSVAPGCPVDFPRGGGHRGGFNVFMTQEAFNAGGGPAFRNTSWCREHLN